MPQDFQGFQSQSHRLLRRNWPNATALAQELYSSLVAPASGMPDYSSSETKARTPSGVLARQRRPLDEHTAHEAIGTQPGRPGYVPPPPKTGGRIPAALAEAIADALS